MCIGIFSNVSAWYIPLYVLLHIYIKFCYLYFLCKHESTPKPKDKSIPPHSSYVMRLLKERNDVIVEIYTLSSCKKSDILLYWILFSRIILVKRTTLRHKLSMIRKLHTAKPYIVRIITVQ